MENHLNNIFIYCSKETKFTEEDSFLVGEACSELSKCSISFSSSDY